MVQHVWRVGHVSSPLSFVPREHRLYAHRFDDPQRQYGTLYCSEFRITCVRERLADLRPSISLQAELARQQGSPSPYLAAGFVGWRLREESVLAPALIRVRRGADIADLHDQALLRDLETRHSALFSQHGVEHLDVEHVMATHRTITQAISRSLYEMGAAGVRYNSHLDMAPCFALFEGRADLESSGAPQPFTDDISELLQVGSDYRLVLQRVEMSLVDLAEAEVQLGAFRLKRAKWREEIEAVHHQVVEATERIHREGNVAITLLESVANEIEENNRVPEEPKHVHGADTRSEQLRATLQQVTDAMQVVRLAAESIPTFRREQDRFSKEARKLEQELERFLAHIRARRLPSEIDAETRLLLEDVRSWTSGPSLQS